MCDGGHGWGFCGNWGCGCEREEREERREEERREFVSIRRSCRRRNNRREENNFCRRQFNKARHSCLFNRFSSFSRCDFDDDF